MARMLQHEVDHLDGRCSWPTRPGQHKEAMRTLRRRAWAWRKRAASGGRTLRLAFLGTPGPPCRPSRALVAAGHDVVLVVTRPTSAGVGGPPWRRARSRRRRELRPRGDRAGRRRRHRRRRRAGGGGRLRAADQAARAGRGPMVNLHFSLLPRWRGAAPVERAVLAGDSRTGVCLMALEEGLDTGPVYACEALAIGADETADDLRDRLGRPAPRSWSTACPRGLGEPQVSGRADVRRQARPGRARDRLVATGCRDSLRLVRLGRAWTTFRGRRLRVLRASRCVGLHVGRARARCRRQDRGRRRRRRRGRAGRGAARGPRGRAERGGVAQRRAPHPGETLGA